LFPTYNKRVATKIPGEILRKQCTLLNFHINFKFYGLEKFYDKSRFLLLYRVLYLFYCIYRVSATGNTGNNNTVVSMVKLMPTRIMVMTSPRIK